MKCQLCILDGITYENDDRTLKEMETHLKEVHHLDEGEREQYGGDFSRDVQAQIEIERKGRARKRQFDLVLMFIGFCVGLYTAFVIWIVATPA